MLSLHESKKAPADGVTQTCAYGELVHKLGHITGRDESEPSHVLCLLSKKDRTALRVLALMKWGSIQFGQLKSKRMKG